MDYLVKKPRKVHPRGRTNLIYKSLFLYAWSRFRKGFKKDLEEDDLYGILPCYKSEKLGNELQRNWEEQQGQKSMAKLLFTTYGLQLFALGVCQLTINLMSIMVQPYTLGKLVLYFTPGQTELTRNDAYFYAALMIGYNLTMCVCRHNFYLATDCFGMMLRTAFCSLIFRKALRFSPRSLGKMSIGKIVTLISRDVYCFQGFGYFANQIWISFVKIIAIGFILYKKIGVAAFAGVGCFIVMMPVQVYLGSKIRKMRTKTYGKSDERLQQTQEALSAMKIIKMYTWENYFTDKISSLRKKEVGATFKIFFLRCLVLTIGILNADIAFYILFMTYLWLGNQITAEVVYYIVNLFQTLSFSLSIMFPLGIYHTAELVAASARIKNLLEAEEVESSETQSEITNPKITLSDLTVGIDEANILKNVSVKFESGLNIITGPVGSGKSFLLKTILQNYTEKSGKLSVQGTISYASQESWLFPASVRQNIIFGEKYDEKRYKEVLEVCALIFDFELLENGDSTVVEDKGMNLSKGQQARINLARAVYKKRDIYLLDDCLSALDSHVGAFIFQECIKKFLQDKLVVLVSHNVKHLPHANCVTILEEGCIKQHGNYPDLSEFAIVERNHHEKELSKDDVDVDNPHEESKLITEKGTGRKVYQEIKKTGNVNKKIYHKYFRIGGGYFLILVILCLFVAAQFSVSYNDKLLSNWVNVEQDIANYTVTGETNDSHYDQLIEQRVSYSKIYTIVVIIAAVASLTRAAVFFLFTRKASIKLHNEMITSIMNASIRFFDNNFIGNILNRFSKDLRTVDEEIPFVYYNVFYEFLSLFGNFFLIISADIFFLIFTLILIISLYFLRVFCIRTPRSLRRLEAITRSPMIGHLNAALEGLTTIRSSKAEAIVRFEFDRHQDLHTSATYEAMNACKAFTYIVDTLCGLFVALIVLRFLLFGEETTAGTVGLAISQSLSLIGKLEWAIDQWTEVENQMTAVERSLEYTEIKQENKQGLTLEEWPKHGKIEYANVSLKYSNSGEAVLKNIKFVVDEREKIGIVGRTGAGKSSIISTLFRLYDIEGKILIDGTDIKILSLDFLRKRISIIPQDPVLFTGTIRNNLDPFNDYTDDQIWKAIEISNLKGFVPSLDLEITESGVNFSLGQRQLICLARAVLKSNKIIVLDEATANVDCETDVLIQKTIEENFRSCTVLIIAHKMSSIMNCDKILVLDQGTIVEYDSPENLLNSPNGAFSKMVKNSSIFG